MTISAIGRYVYAFGSWLIYNSAGEGVGSVFDYIVNGVIDGVYRRHDSSSKFGKVVGLPLNGSRLSRFTIAFVGNGRTQNDVLPAITRTNGGYHVLRRNRLNREGLYFVRSEHGRCATQPPPKPFFRSANRLRRLNAVHTAFVFS